MIKNLCLILALHKTLLWKSVQLLYGKVRLLKCKVAIMWTCICNHTIIQLNNWIMKHGYTGLRTLLQQYVFWRQNYSHFWLLNIISMGRMNAPVCSGEPNITCQLFPLGSIYMSLSVTVVVTQGWNGGDWCDGIVVCLLITSQITHCDVSVQGTLTRLTRRAYFVGSFCLK